MTIQPAAETATRARMTGDRQQGHDAAVADADQAPDRRLHAKPPVSVYIRTLNEARMVGEVIAAAKKLSDDIVIVDSGSSDGTPDIAASAGARVLTNPWPGNGHQKRVGEDACKYDWLLDLDADEIIDEGLIAAIQELFADGGEPARSVYAVKLITVPPVGQPWTDFCLAYRNKFYDRRVWRMPAHPAWDQLALPKATQPQVLAGAILHRSFADFADFVRKLNSVSTARAKYMKPRPLWALRLRIFFAFPIYFIKHYLFRGLFRAGTYGFAVAAQSAHARWLRDVKMYERAKFAAAAAAQDRPSQAS